MFYLIHFFKFIIIEGLRGHLFLFFSMALLSICLWHREVNQIVRVQFRVERPDPYFYALITGNQNMDSLHYRLNNIPGVKKIKTRKAFHLQGQVKELLGDLGLQELYQNEIYQGLQIFLSPKSKERTYAFMKEYMSRLLGDSNVILGRLKYPGINLLKKKESGIRFLRKWGYLIAIFIIGFFWLLSLLNIAPHFRRYCYLIEEYQRKKYVGVKMMAVWPPLLLAISLSGLILLKKTVLWPLDIHSSVVILVPFSLMVILSFLICFRLRWH
ncbi:MAG: hypothetical protein OXB88_02090 [Bacteriovoracales bacterium]|nr:hypothetical protein [Bacteriovoracales bacterium]